MLLVLQDYIFLVFFVNDFSLPFLFVDVVRGFDESGTESEESFVETSYEDPLSHREYSFTGNFLFQLCERKESNKFCLVDAKKGSLSLF